MLMVVRAAKGGDDMFNGIDFYSDTVTRPSQAMKQAMMDAPLGDEQKGEDPTTNRLEAKMAEGLGKSAAMFFPSATMCNQIAVKLHCQPGEEVIGADSCHIFNLEGGGAAFHSSVQARMIPTKDGTFDGEQVRDQFRYSDGPHTPKSALLLVENTTNVGGGVAWPPKKLASVLAVAKELKLKTHLDGARLFNAALASSSNIKKLASGFDTITICFSKGLACATGAILAFDQQHWTKVRRLKQVFGGAMRQSGILAAACLYALDHQIEQLAVDHKNAEDLGAGLAKINGILVENPKPSSNMVFFAVDDGRMDPDKFLDHCLEYNLRFSRVSFNRFRAVTHKDISAEQIEQAITKLQEIFSI